MRNTIYFIFILLFISFFINLEYNLFVEIRDKCKEYIKVLQKNAKVISEIDVLQSFAFVSEKYGYVRPILNSTNEIKVISSRHPVVEKVLKDAEYVPNDIIMDNNTDILLITGPNMAGKSTYMRQVALIVLMAQIGSFVPASYAKIGVVDKIFTRVGASDDLSMGQSTFMVEMMEVANILKEATANSLVVLDEIGRGTSTYDGLSIADSEARLRALRREARDGARASGLKLEPSLFVINDHAKGPPADTFSKRLFCFPVFVRSLLGTK